MGAIRPFKHAEEDLPQTTQKQTAARANQMFGRR
jgi:hypothetical protein